MELVTYLLLGFDGILCLIIIVLMLLQAGKGAGSSIMGGESTSDDGEGYLSHSKDRSREGRLRRATMTCGVLFLIITYVIGLLFIVNNDVDNNSVDNNVENSSVQNVDENNVDENSGNEGNIEQQINE